MYFYRKFDEDLQVALDGPGLDPPQGMTSNFSNPQNIDRISYITISLCIALSTLAMVLRLYTKFRLMRVFGWEDWTAIVGFLFTVVFTGLTVILVRDGAGRHQWDVRLRDLPPIFYNYNILTILYCFATFFIKISILIQYIRIFVPPGQKNFMWWSCWIMMVLNLVFYVGAFFFELFLCNPRQKIWEPWVDGQCRDSATSNIAAGVFNSVNVLFMIVLPMITLMGLNMPMHQKIKASSIFLIGVFALVASIVRTVYAAKLKDSGDETYDIQAMQLWISAEYATTIICSCLPSFPILFRQAWAWFSGTLRKAGLSMRGNNTVIDAEYYAGSSKAGKKAAGPQVYGYDKRRKNNAFTNVSEWELSNAVHLGSDKDGIRDLRKWVQDTDEDKERYGGITVTKDVIVEQEIRQHS